MGSCRSTTRSPSRTPPALSLLHRFDPGPVRTTVSSGGTVVPVTMGRGDFGYAVRGLLYDAAANRTLPDLIGRAVAGGDFREFAQAYWRRQVAFRSRLRLWPAPVGALRGGRAVRLRRGCDSRGGRHRLADADQRRARRPAGRLPRAALTTGVLPEHVTESPGSVSRQNGPDCASLTAPCPSLRSNRSTAFSHLRPARS